MSDLNTVNNLIEQNEARAQALSVEVDRATNCVSEVEQLIVDLNAALSSTNENSQARFEALSSVLDASEQTLEENMQAARERFESLQQKISALDGHIDSISTEAKTQLDDLKSHTESMLSELETEVETTQANLNELAEHIQTSESEGTEQGETTKSSLESFKDAVNTAQTTFEERKKALIEQFESLEQDLDAKMELVVSAFDTLVEEGNKNLTALGDTVEATSSEAADTLNQKFTGDVQNLFSESVEGLNGAMSLLSELGETSQDLLDGQLGDVIGSIDEVLDVVKPVLDVLDKVQDMLG